MQLTRHTDFSLRVLIYLALIKENELVTISEISEHFNILKNHLTKVVNHLSQEGFIKTIRGKNGGIRLARKPNEINLGKVVRAMEMNMEIIDCAKPVCPLTGFCDLKGILNQAQQSFLTTLDKYTLADLNNQPQQVKSLLQWPVKESFQK